MNQKIEVIGLYKIFGSKPDEALRLLDGGLSKEEVLIRTGCAVGVQNTSFTVDEGEIFVVMGLSGSGKSTLVRMLNGLIKPTSGKILVDSIDVASADDRQLRAVRLDKITMVFQHYALFPHKTVLDNVAYGLKIKGLPAAERAERALAALEQVGLAAYAGSYPDALSGGMRQRVGLARGLAVEAEILLMDEPFGALDPLIRRDMQAELLELQQRLHKTIVFITHDLNEALILGDKIAIMKEGSFVQVGTAEEIVGQPSDDYVRAFTQDIDRSRVFSAAAVAGDPAALDLHGDTAKTAVERMETLGRDALYVMDGAEIAGIVTYRDANVATRQNAGLGTAVTETFSAVAEDTPLHELYPLCAGGLPVAVVDADRSLIGVVEPRSVFAQLVRDDTVETPAEAMPTATAA